MTTTNGALLCVDFGSVWTRVLLIDVVEGEYRVVARGEALSTLGAPFNDAELGLERILRDMTQSGVREFFDKAGSLIMPERNDRAGVDALIVSTSAGRALRIVLVGLDPDYSLKSALRALRGSVVEVVETLSASDPRDEEARLNALLLSRADMIFIAGGTEGGTRTTLRRLIREVQFAIAVTDRTLRPVVVYAGNSDLNEEIQEGFESLTQVLIAPNVRPSLSTDASDSALTTLSRAYASVLSNRNAHFANLNQLSAVGILPSTQSAVTLARYLAQVHQGRVLAVDMGSASCTIISADAQDKTSTNGSFSVHINAQMGVGTSADTLLQAVGRATLEAWLPFYTSDEELQHYALNKTLRPASIPMTLRDLYLEQAFARAGLHSSLEAGLAEAHPYAPILLVNGSVLTRSGTPFADLLLIADSLQTRGISAVYADTYGLIAALGGIAQVNAGAFVQLVENNLAPLGTLIRLEGAGQTDKVVARLKVTTEQGDSYKTELKGGHLLSLPLPQGAKLKLEFHLVGAWRLAGKRRVKLELEGGTAGILIDARGTRLQAGTTPTERAQNLVRWLQESTDLEAPSIPPEWLIAPQDEQNAEAFGDVFDLDELRQSTEAPKRRFFGSRGKNAPKAAKPAKAETGKPAKGKPDKPAKAGKTGKNNAAETSPPAFELDDEFAALIAEDDANGAKKSTTSDLGNLRDLL